MSNEYNVYLNTTSIGIGLIINRIFENENDKKGVAWGFIKYLPAKEIKNQRLHISKDIKYIGLEELLYTISKEFINNTAFQLSNYESSLLNEKIMPDFDEIENINLDKPDKLLSLCWSHEDLIRKAMGTISPDTKLYEMLVYFNQLSSLCKQNPHMLSYN